MGKAREINKINCAMTMCLSLVTAYNDMVNLNDGNPITKSTQAFSDLKVNHCEPPFSNYIA